MTAGGDATPGPDEQARYRAVLALDGCTAPSLRHLLEALDDPSWRVRAAAAERIAAVADPRSALPALLAALRPGTPSGRSSAAASALVQLGPAALDALAGSLSAAEPETRSIAAEILGDIGERRAVALVAPALRDPDPNVRAAAAEALGKLGGADAVAALRLALRGDDPLLRRAALDALWRLHASPDVEQLRELARDERLRRLAYRVAGFSPDAAAVDLLLDGLRDRSRGGREAALAGIGQQRFRGATALAAVVDRVRAIAREDPGLVAAAGAALRSDDARLKAGAIAVIAWTGGVEHAAAVAHALQDERVRAIASEALVTLGHGAAAALGEVLPRLAPGARAAALAALARLGDGAVLPLLCADAASADDAVRAAALDGIGALGDPRAIRPLVALLEHRDPAIASGAAAALARLCRAGAARDEALAACRRDGPVGAARCRLLGGIGEARDAPLLRRALAERDPAARATAAEALAALHARDSLAARAPELLDLLEDLDAQVRAAAAQALGVVSRGDGWPEAARALAVALRDEDPTVRARAAQALGRAGARSYATALAQLAGDVGAPPEAVAAAVAALAELGDPDPAVLERAARHPDPEVVKEAVAAAGLLPGDTGAALLLTAADHARWDVRRAAARAIGRRGDPALLEPARRLQAVERDALVAEALCEAVRILEAEARGG